MSIKKRGLGRGLDALIGAAGLGRPDENAASATSASTADSSTLPVDLLQRGRYQPRRDFNNEALEELANSIRAQGLIQPVVVRPVPPGSTVVGIPGKVVRRRAETDDDLDHGKLPDPEGQAIAELRERVAKLEQLVKTLAAPSTLSQ